ncbi:YdbL family protein [Pantoea alhagi]|uniref:YdbL family protein n=1 Tax=Pantoea alhagi TaxID=1891675 RepID=UPI00202B387D|nr:YdbL family protein [Pantoea alhagi]URQ62579.1 YdbL family protein [Pantoea alhagi]
MKGWIALFLLCMLTATPAQALTLDEARQQGRVGETLSGYLAARQHDAETEALITHINQQREQRYREVAQRNQLSTTEVARIAGEKLVQRAAAGEYVQGINGRWVRKQ